MHTSIVDNRTDEHIVRIEKDLQKWIRDRSDRSQECIDHAIGKVVQTFRTFFENGYEWVGPYPQLEGDVDCKQQTMGCAVMLVLHFCECGLGLAADYAGIDRGPFPQGRMTIEQYEASQEFAYDLAQDFKRQMNDAKFNTTFELSITVH